MAKKIVMIVEDDPEIRESLKELLEIEGYPVIQAKDGQEALDVLMAKPVLPSLILLDLMMPIMDGQTFLMQIRQNEDFSKLKSLPVLIVSAARQQVQGEVVGHLRKPIDTGVLLDYVAKYCD